MAACNGRIEAKREVVVVIFDDDDDDDDDVSLKAVAPN
jgi:hypothetical protein